MRGEGQRGAGAPAPLWALAELRLRLTWRRLRGRGGIPELVARVSMAAMALPAGIIFAALTGLHAYRAVRSSGVSAALAPAALFFGVWQAWTVVGVTLSDRESFELRRLLVYPVSPAHAYAHELLASLVGDPFSLFWSVLLLGAFAGAALARPGAWLLLLSATYLLFAAATVALVALLQELLARALRARRVRELGVAAIYIGLMLLVVWASGRGPGAAIRALRALAQVRWVAYPAALATEVTVHLYRGHTLAALPWLGGLGLATAGTTWAAYRLALAEAMSGGEGAGGGGAAKGGGWRLPGRVGPLLELELKYLLRHPLTAVLGLVVPGVAAMVGWRATPMIPPEAGEVVRALPLFGFALYALLVTQGVWLNVFGRDRGGVRLWFLAPLELADVLRAKNAAVRVLAFGLFAASAAMLFATGGLPPPWAILAALLLHLGLGPFYVAAGNLVSVLNPRPGSHGLQRGASLAPASALAGIAIFSAGAALFAPPVLLALRLDRPWVLTTCWAGLGLLGAVIRRATAAATARLVERRREALVEAVAGDL